MEICHEKATDHVVSILIAIAACITFDLFPFNRMDPAFDASVFVYIAQRMHEGYVPYRDIFDHKGPVLYLIHYIGLFAGKTGIWFLELVTMYWSSFFIIKLSSLLTEKRIISYLTSFGTLAALGMNIYDGGDFTEFWSLPWIIGSLYVFVKFIKTKEYANIGIFLTGISFAIVFLLRVNNAVLWVFVLPCACIMLIKLKRSSEILRCALLFSGGALSVATPTLLYLVISGALDDFIEYYLVFNMAYTGHHSISEMIECISSMFFYIETGVFFIAASVFVSFLRRRYRLITVFNLVLFVLSLFAAVISVRQFGHYLIIVLQFFAVPISICLDAVYSIKWPKASESAKQREGFLFPVIMYASLMIIIISGMIITCQDTDTEKKDSMAEYVNLNTLPDDDVFIVSANPYTYLKTGRHTDNKFFFQSALNNDVLFEEFKKELERVPSDRYLIEGVYHDGNTGTGIAGYLEAWCSDNGYLLEQHDGFYAFVKPRPEVDPSS
ncbi:MAG: hypothetical protein IKE53_01670 [Clostridiales bacterium]|nr:hypothetical protein [Clostridiales bacterium]